MRTDDYTLDYITLQTNPVTIYNSNKLISNQKLDRSHVIPNPPANSDGLSTRNPSNIDDFIRNTFLPYLLFKAELSSNYINKVGQGTILGSRYFLYDLSLNDHTDISFVTTISFEQLSIQYDSAVHSDDSSDLLRNYGFTASSASSVDMYNSNIIDVYKYNFTNQQNEGTDGAFSISVPIDLFKNTNDASFGWELWFGWDAKNPSYYDRSIIPKILDIQIFPQLYPEDYIGDLKVLNLFLKAFTIVPVLRWSDISSIVHNTSEHNPIDISSTRLKSGLRNTQIDDTFVQEHFVTYHRNINMKDWGYSMDVSYIQFFHKTTYTDISNDTINTFGVNNNYLDPVIYLIYYAKDRLLSRTNDDEGYRRHLLPATSTEPTIDDSLVAEYTSLVELLP